MDGILGKGGASVKEYGAPGLGPSEVREGGYRLGAQGRDPPDPPDPPDPSGNY